MDAEMNKMQCCFVNTEQKPIKIRRTGLFSYTKQEFIHKTIYSELCEVFYPHPDAPEDAMVSVFRFLTVEFPLGFDATAVNCIDAMKGLQSVATPL